MFFRKLFSIFVVIAVALLVAACSSPSNEKNNASEPSADALDRNDANSGKREPVGTDTFNVARRKIASALKRVQVERQNESEINPNSPKKTDEPRRPVEKNATWAKRSPVVKEPANVPEWKKPEPSIDLETMWKPEIKKPNIIVITLDTTRPDYLGCYGHPFAKTPNIDKFASEGVQFLDAQTPASSTLASHTSLFTGSYPHTTGVSKNQFKVMDENVMLAELLRDLGYHTAAIIGGTPLNPYFNFQQGFDLFDVEQTNLSPNIYMVLKSAENVVDKSIEQLEQKDKEKPIFLFMHFFDAHGPYVPFPEFDKWYKDIFIPNFTKSDEVAEKMKELEGKSDKSYRAIQRYIAEISYIDHHLGRFFEWLKENDLYEDSMILITSDHGESCWDNPPNFEHGHHTYQSTTWAVGLWHLPGNAFQGAKSENYVSTIDFMPTLCAYLDIPLPERVEGEAIDMALAVENKLPVRTRFSEATKWGDTNIPAPTGWQNFFKHKSIRRGNYKLLFYPITGKYEMYDIPNDKLERNNLLPAKNKKLRKVFWELKKELESWSYDRDIESSDVVEKGSEMDEQMKALGYL